MDDKTNELFKRWQERNILGFYCNNKDEAVNKILEIVPQAATAGISGSVTLDQLAIVKHLEVRGNKVFSQYKPGISKEESLEMRRQGTLADYYLASANAISEKGELVFLSAYGHRIAGITYAKNVIIVCGVNKITPNLEEAIKRAKEYAMPLNYKRLNWDSSKIMCCQVLIIEAEAAPDRPEGRGLASDKPQGNGLASYGQSHRLKVILVGEELGF